MESYLAPSAAPEREGTSRRGYAHTIIATSALGAITILPARRQMRAFPVRSPLFQGPLMVGTLTT
jgi:hypothetical protein